MWIWCQWGIPDRVPEAKRKARQLSPYPQSTWQPGPVPEVPCPLQRAAWCSRRPWHYCADSDKIFFTGVVSILWAPQLQNRASELNVLRSLLLLNLPAWVLPVLPTLSNPFSLAHLPPKFTGTWIPKKMETPASFSCMVPNRAKTVCSYSYILFHFDKKAHSSSVSLWHTHTATQPLTEIFLLSRHDQSEGTLLGRVAEWASCI